MPTTTLTYALEKCLAEPKEVTPFEPVCLILEVPVTASSSRKCGTTAAALNEACFCVSLDQVALTNALSEQLGNPELSELLKSRSEEHTSELQSLMRISYAVFCLKTKNTNYQLQNNHINTNTYHRY